MELEFAIFILGIITSIVGWGILQFVITPLRNFHEFKATVGRDLLYYSGIITSPGSGKLADEAHPVLRRLAVELEEKYLLVNMKSLFESMGLLPSVKQAVNSKGGLLYLSNSLDGNGKTDENCRELESIYTSLNINELDPRYNQKYPEAIKIRKIRMGKKYTPMQ